MIVGLTVWSRKRMAEKNRGLYRQIKEQDRLADELEAMTKQYEQIKSLVPAAQEERLTATANIKLPSIEQQRQLVARMRAFLLRDRFYATFDIELQEVVNNLATNRTYLFEALKAVTGQSPMDFINVIRLEEAKRLLEYSDLTIETLASDCGFRTSRTFYRQFKEHYRITPSEYRKIAKSQA
jgi:AraC-like DNA-binding protein